MKTAYEQLTVRFAQLSRLGHIGGILSKDSQTVMAEGSAEDRIGQMTTLADIGHMLICAPEMSDLLDTAEAEKVTLSAPQQKNLELMRKSWVHANALPSELAESVAHIEAQGEQTHTKQLKTGDSSEMASWYEHVFTTAREVARLKQDALGTASPYEALLDIYSPGTSEADVDRVFTQLEQELPALLQQAIDKQAQEPAPLPLVGPFPLDQQRELIDRLAKKIGFDFNRGRLDLIAGHPSMSGSPDDARLTAESNEDDFIMPLYSALHEAGHGMYEQGTPAEWRYQPVGSSLGMDVHESQSMIQEKQSCKTDAFFELLETEARAIFNRPDDPALSAENMKNIINRAERSLIRIEADDLTYPLHVIMRYKIEKGVINGEFEPSEIEQRWNDLSQNLLGIVPSKSVEGHTQDVHWGAGYIGYFPSYALGALYAAQFFAKACEDHPEIREGDFDLLKNWLNENIHSKGSLLTPSELCIQATGEPLNAKYFLQDIKEKLLGKSVEGPDLGGTTPGAPDDFQPS